MVKDIDVIPLSKLKAEGRRRKISSSQIDAACRQEFARAGFAEISSW
jgi:hypothetical protein